MAGLSDPGSRGSLEDAQGGSGACRAAPSVGGGAVAALRQVLPELLRDLGAPFGCIWEQLHQLHGPREAAWVFAELIGQLEPQGCPWSCPL